MLMLLSFSSFFFFLRYPAAWSAVHGIVGSRKKRNIRTNTFHGEGDCFGNFVKFVYFVFRILS